MASTSDVDIFNSKYEEFANDLKQTFPELISFIDSSFALSEQERKIQFREQVLPFCSPKRGAKGVPECVLPGVKMTHELWSSISDSSKDAIQEYLTILSFCLMMQSSNFSENQDWNSEYAKKVMDDMASKMKDIDFSGFAEKIGKIFGGTDPSKIPQIPEKFLKGQIAKLAEEIVKEIRIEDFGLDEQKLKEASANPALAMGMISELFTKNPEVFQKTIAKVVKKLQHKVQTGAIRPQEMVAECEELIKSFTENPAFTEMMETIRQMFGGGDDMADMQKAAGRDGNARLSIVQERLRKKLEAKKAAKK
jgi:hypothetical protein